MKQICTPHICDMRVVVFAESESKVSYLDVGLPTALRSAGILVGADSLHLHLSFANRSAVHIAGDGQSVADAM